MRIKLRIEIALFLIFTLLSMFSPISAAEVSNKDEPKKGDWDFGLTKVWELEQINGEVFGGINSITSDESGTVYVMDNKRYKVYILDSNGKFISAFGKRGEGPGEIKRMGRCFLTNNKLLFPDGNRIHFFSPKGKYIETKVIPNSLRPREMINDNIIISVPFINWEDPKARGKFSIYDIEKKEEKLLFEFSTYKKGIVRETSGSNNSTFSYSTSYLTPMMSLDYQPKTKRLYYGMTNEYKIMVRDLGDVVEGGKGKNTLVFSVNREKKDVPKGFKDELLEGLDWPDRVKKQIKNGFPDVLTQFIGFRADQRGYIYVYHNEPFVEHRRTMDIFSPDGVYIYKGVIAVEEGSSLGRSHWNGDNLYLVSEDEDGELKLIKYKIKLPE